MFLKEYSLEGRVEPGKLKRKWENLKQKYKVRMKKLLVSRVCRPPKIPDILINNS